MLFYRGPLASAFKLHIQDIALFQNPETGQDMDHLCLRTDGLAEKYKHNIIMTKMLPDYGCLMLSPANLWQKDPRAFQMDSNVISTVFNFQVSSTYKITMLKKLSKCEVKSWLYWNLIILSPLCFYMKSNFGKFKRSKNVIFGNLETLNFAFW